MLQKRSCMKNTLNIMFILMLLVSGVLGIFLMCYLTPMSGGNGNDGNRIVGITNVVMGENEYFVNQPVSVEGAKICLKLNDGSQEWVDLQLSNVEGFDTSNVGHFECKINYGGFNYMVPYSVSYKKTDMSNNCLFNLNEIIDLNEIKLDLYDYYDKIVGQKNLANCYVDGLSTASVGTYFARAVFDEYQVEFDYQVNYKKIELFFANGQTDLNFKVGQSIGGLAVICYDDLDRAVTILPINDENVFISGFDTTTASLFTRKAKVYCFGANAEFEYNVL